MTETCLCEGCGAEVPCYRDSRQRTAIIGGLRLDITGHYNGFTDNYDGSDFSSALNLCHDCVLDLIALFPILRAKFGGGCHPCDESLPCCEHAWTVIERKSYRANETLDGWVPL